MVRSLSLTQQRTILSLLDSGLSGEAIAKRTGVSPSTISKLHSKEHPTLLKAIGSHPPKLSPTNIHCAQHLITSGKAENTVQVTKTLSNLTNQPLSASTVCLHLKKASMKAVVKTKHPILSARHCKACLDFAYSHKD
ncbi:hypothetical protein EDD16DRAFT_1481290, partial [Pisolithus croceorrhizus]